MDGQRKRGLCKGWGYGAGTVRGRQVPEECRCLPHISAQRESALHPVKMDAPSVIAMVL